MAGTSPAMTSLDLSARYYRTRGARRNHSTSRTPFSSAQLSCNISPKTKEPRETIDAFMDGGRYRRAGACIARQRAGAEAGSHEAPPRGRRQVVPLLSAAHDHGAPRLFQGSRAG